MSTALLVKSFNGLHSLWKVSGNLTTLHYSLTLLMLGLLSFKAQRRKDFWNTSEPCHVGIHLIALVGHSQMSTHLLGFSLASDIF